MPSESRRRIPIPESVQCRITKFFVTNLPDGCSGADLAAQVRPYGQIFDLYIARKRDKGGNRFGFISLLDVKDKDELLKSLRNIRMGEFKLWFSIARFVLEDGEINNRRDRQEQHQTRDSFKGKSVEDPMEVKTNSFFSGDRSFKDLLVGKSIKSLTVDNKMNAFAKLHGRALVARMADYQSLKNIKVILHEFYTGDFVIQYLGGLDLLMTFEDTETATAVRLAVAPLVDKFSMVSAWEGQALGFERLAWLKIQGVPLHLLLNEVVDAVGGLFGRVVHKAKRSDSNPDLSYDYVGVLAGDGKRVSEEVVLNWNNRKFQVWVMEELGEWTPEFVEPEIETETVPSDSEEEAMSEDHSSEEDHRVDDGGNGNADVTGKTKTFLETVQPFISNYENLSLPMKNQPNIPEDFDGAFTPGVDFCFDEVAEVLEENSVSKVCKRKKFKKYEVGRPSGAYTSSQESQKITKKSKNNDPFGLDSMLGLVDGAENTNEEEDQVTDSVSNEEGSLDLNNMPSQSIFSGKENQSPRSNGQKENGAIGQADEVAATIILGEKLGVNLQDSHTLIQESITIEGLQGGKP